VSPFKESSRIQLVINVAIADAGRRNLMIFGAVGGAIAMYYIGAYIKIGRPQLHPTTTLSSGGISAMAFFYLVSHNGLSSAIYFGANLHIQWTIFYSLSWNGTPWIVNAEMFPGHTRGVTQTLSAASNWLWNFVISRATPTMFTSMVCFLALRPSQ